MEKRSKESKRVYVIMSILFIAIFVLLMIFICKKWCWVQGLQMISFSASLNKILAISMHKPQDNVKIFCVDDIKSFKTNLN